MPFHVGSGCLPATISNSRIYRIAWSDTPPEMSSWEKGKEFFCSTHQTAALECIRTICHPPAGTTREDVVSRFELLRTLAYAGWEENIHSGLHGENYFCILDENSQEILSVTLDDAGNYTVNCQGYSETHHFTMETEPGVERTEHAEGASGTSCLPATTAPQTAAEYDAVWSAWEMAAPEGEARGRAAVVQEMRDCLNNGNPVLNVGAAGLTTLPDHLPPHITTLIIPDNNLTSLSTLPSGLQELIFAGNQLPSLPALPSGLRELIVVESPLTSLPDLPSGLCKLWAFNNQLASLPTLPPSLRELSVDGNLLPSLPALPSGLQSLSASHNQMASLPTLPPGLEELVVDGNQLPSLPALPLRLQKLSVSHNQLTHLSALPPGLQSLWATNNRLTSLSALPPGLEELVVSDNLLPSLPALPPGLRTLRASNNRLTRLTESITGLSSEATVHLEGNLLSERTLQTMQNLTSAPDYSGPRIRFDMAGPSVPRDARALHLAVADWLMPAR
ncbi:E3 ubiquitin--protein ligase, partial [Salmonella enterica]|nr:E3 ubiquitin--protein ligase [Salmonella enterica]